MCKVPVKPVNRRFKKEIFLPNFFLKSPKIFKKT